MDGVRTRSKRVVDVTRPPRITNSTGDGLLRSPRRRAVSPYAPRAPTPKSVVKTRRSGWRPRRSPVPELSYDGNPPC